MMNFLSINSRKKSLERKLTDLKYLGTEIQESSDHCERLINEALYDMQRKLQDKGKQLISVIRQMRQEKLQQTKGCVKVINSELEEILQINNMVKDILNLNDVCVLYDKIPGLLQKTCVSDVDQSENQNLQEIKIGDSFHAIVEGRINEKGEFWVVKDFDRYPEVLEELELMKMQIRKEVFFKTKKFDRNQSLVEGSLCFGLFDQDGCWLRAVVEKLIPEQGMAQLRWLDYGHISDVFLDNVVAMTNEYQQLPFQAVRCCLFEDLEQDLPRDARWEFTDRTLGQPILCTVKKQLSYETLPCWLVEIECFGPNQKDVMKIMEEKIKLGKERQDTITSRDIRLTINPDAFTVKSSATVTDKSSDTVTDESYDAITDKSPVPETDKSFDVVTVKSSDTDNDKSSDTDTVKSSDAVTVKSSDTATVKSSDTATVKSSDTVTVKSSDTVTVKSSDAVTVKSSDTATDKSANSATAAFVNTETIIVQENTNNNNPEEPQIKLVLPLATEACNLEERCKPMEVDKDKVLIEEEVPNNYVTENDQNIAVAENDQNIAVTENDQNIAVTENDQNIADRETQSYVSSSSVQSFEVNQVEPSNTAKQSQPEVEDDEVDVSCEQFSEMGTSNEDESTPHLPRNVSQNGLSEYEIFTDEAQMNPVTVEEDDQIEKDTNVVHATEKTAVNEGAVLEKHNKLLSDGEIKKDETHDERLADEPIDDYNLQETHCDRIVIDMEEGVEAVHDDEKIEDDKESRYRNLARQFVSGIMSQIITDNTVCEPITDTQDEVTSENDQQVNYSACVVTEDVNKNGDSYSTGMVEKADTAVESSHQNVCNDSVATISSQSQQCENDSEEFTDWIESTDMKERRDCSGSEAEPVTQEGLVMQAFGESGKGSQMTRDTNIEQSSPEDGKNVEHMNTEEIKISPSEMLQSSSQSKRLYSTSLIEEQNRVKSSSDTANRYSQLKAYALPFVPKSDQQERGMCGNDMDTAEIQTSKPIMPSRVRLDASLCEPVTVSSVSVKSDLTSNGRFWVQRVRDDNEETCYQMMLANMMRDMPKQPQCIIHYYKIVAVYDEKDKQWYRARVEKQEDNKVLACLIDYGYTLWVSLHHIRELPPEYQAYPQQAIECSMKCYSRQEFSEHAMCEFRKLTKDKILVATIPLKLQLTSDAQYIWLRNPATNLWINNEIFKIDHGFEHSLEHGHPPLMPPQNCVVIPHIVHGSYPISMLVPHLNQASHQYHTISQIPRQASKPLHIHHHGDSARYQSSKMIRESESSSGVSFSQQGILPIPAPLLHHQQTQPRPILTQNRSEDCCYSLPSKLPLPGFDVNNLQSSKRAARSMDNLIQFDEIERAADESHVNQGPTSNLGDIIIQKKENQSHIEESILMFDDDAWVEGRNPITDSPLTPEEVKTHLASDDFSRSQLPVFNKLGGNFQSGDGAQNAVQCYLCGEFGHRQYDCRNAGKKGKMRHTNRKTQKPRHK
ncbi:uncharacterized protein [Ptychodera flava]|uniref:uncharacterized protein n=1 Tax=Ptychodera flava TaxID=63121 RepID=UPI00396A5A8F